MRKLFFLLLTVVVAGCNFHDKIKDDATSSIEKANQSLMSGHPDSAAVKNAKTSVESFVGRFPEDSISPSLLFDLALVYEKQKQYDSCTKTLARIYDQYPNSKDAGKAVFLQGFLYANVLNQLDKAKTAYQLYLDKYSSVDAKMTGDVKMELQNLGKSPDEILREIQEKAKMDSASARS